MTHEMGGTCPMCGGMGQHMGGGMGGMMCGGGMKMMPMMMMKIAKKVGLSEDQIGLPSK